MLGHILLDIAQNLVFLFCLHILEQLHVFCSLRTRSWRNTELGSRRPWRRWYLHRFLFRLSAVSRCVRGRRPDLPYLLVDEILVIVLDTQFPFHLLDLLPLQEDLSLHGKQFFSCQLALSHQGNQLASIFELLSESPQLLGALSISTAGLANLADLASTETHVWISVIGILTGLEL
mgnify:CR=1 FL=1